MSTYPPITGDEWKDPTGRNAGWSSFLRSVSVHVPATASLETNPTIRAMRRILAEAKAARPRDCPHNPGGYDGDDGTPKAFYAIISNVPPSVVDRVRTMRLPKKAELRTWST